MILSWNGSYIEPNSINFQSLQELEISLSYGIVLEQGIVTIDEYNYPSAWFKTSKNIGASLSTIIDQWSHLWGLTTLGSHIYQQRKNRFIVIYCLPRHQGRFYPLQKIWNLFYIEDQIRAVLLRAEIWGLKRFNIQNCLVVRSKLDTCELTWIGITSLLKDDFVDWNSSALDLVTFEHYFPRRKLLSSIMKLAPHKPDRLPFLKELEIIIKTINPNLTDVPYFFSSRWTHFQELLEYDIQT